MGEQESNVGTLLRGSVSPSTQPSEGAEGSLWRRLTSWSGYYYDDGIYHHFKHIEYGNGNIGNGHNGGGNGHNGGGKGQECSNWDDWMGFNNWGIIIKGSGSDGYWPQYSKTIDLCRQGCQYLSAANGYVASSTCKGWTWTSDKC